MPIAGPIRDSETGMLRWFLLRRIIGSTFARRADRSAGLWRANAAARWPRRQHGKQRDCYIALVSLGGNGADDIWEAVGVKATFLHLSS